MKLLRLGDDGYMAVKLDMSKAYDRVECCFLEDLMRQMRFNERWIWFIMVSKQFHILSLLTTNLRI